MLNYLNLQPYTTAIGLLCIALISIAAFAEFRYYLSPRAELYSEEADSVEDALSAVSEEIGLLKRYCKWLTVGALASTPVLLIDSVSIHFVDSLLAVLWLITPTFLISTLITFWTSQAFRISQRSLTLSIVFVASVAALALIVLSILTRIATGGSFGATSVTTLSAVTLAIVCLVALTQLVAARRSHDIFEGRGISSVVLQNFPDGAPLSKPRDLAPLAVLTCTTVCTVSVVMASRSNEVFSWIGFVLAAMSGAGLFLITAKFARKGRRSIRGALETATDKKLGLVLDRVTVLVGFSTPLVLLLCREPVELLAGNPSFNSTGPVSSLLFGFGLLAAPVASVVVNINLGSREIPHGLRVSTHVATFVVFASFLTAVFSLISHLYLMFFFGQAVLVASLLTLWIVVSKAVIEFERTEEDYGGDIRFEHISKLPFRFEETGMNDVLTNAGWPADQCDAVLAKLISAGLLQRNPYPANDITLTLKGLGQALKAVEKSVSETRSD